MVLSSYFLVALVLVANLVVLPYFLILFLISLSGLLKGTLSRQTADGTANSRFLIIVPAHDEEVGIAETVKSCLGFDYPKDRYDLTVIADNCTDSTAAIARQAGATVVERSDPVKKSKGYAIEYLFESLQETGRFDDYTAYVIIDADTIAEPNLLSAFDKALSDGHDWLQAYYTVSNPDDSWRTRLMTYAFSLVNGVALFGQNAIGLSAGFRGNGMCFSTEGLRRFPFRVYGLVEDIEYSWELRIAGESVTFVPETSVSGKMVASSGKAATSQRKRWEYGRSELKKSKAGPLWRSSRLGILAKLGSLLELTMPTMVALAAIYLVLTGLNTLTMLTIARPENPPLFSLLILFQVMMTLGVVLYGMSPFLVMHVPWRYSLTLAFFPAYALWKIIAIGGGKPKEWVRTARET